MNNVYLLCNCFVNAKVETMAGGLTNQVFVVSMLNSPEKKVLRIYGEGSEQWTDRKREEYIHRVVSSMGIAPAIVESWENGRVETFLSGRTLTFWKDLYDEKVIKWVAKSVATLHKSSNPVFQTVSFVEEWVVRWRGQHESALVQNVLHAYDTWKSFGIQSPFVLCHNDLNMLNMLMDEEGECVRFIDYEYAGWNYRGYDLANLYCEVYFHNATEEWPHFCFDSQGKKWSASQFWLFCECYLREYLGREDVSEEEIVALQEEVIWFEPLSHLVWGLWGLFFVGKTDVSFGYKEYGMRRLEECQRLFKCLGVS